MGERSGLNRKETNFGGSFTSFALLPAVSAFQCGYPQIRLSRLSG